MKMDKKNILFLTGTRADYGKLKPLMRTVEQDNSFELHVFVTGMHMHKLYGNTWQEVFKDNYDTIFRYFNNSNDDEMDITLSRTIEGLSDYVHEIKTDLIVIHGDRVEALAGAIVGALNNILVAHIEGGELSGTVDEIIRHSVSKLSHTHFVSNDSAKKRLIQMGELPNSIFEIGSPDLDIMFSKNLPTINDVLDRYEIPFEKYGIVMFHPVTTELGDIKRQAENLVRALLESSLNYIVIYPNNDSGSRHILDAYNILQKYDRFRILPSMRFEFFLTALKNSQICIGNSSAGIREAPAYGIPTVNIGTRQDNRTENDSIINTEYDQDSVLNGINQALSNGKIPISHEFGSGNSAKEFSEIINSSTYWSINKQKKFLDIDAIK